MDSPPPYSKITVVSRVFNYNSVDTTQKHYEEPAIEKYVCYRLKTIIGELLREYIGNMTMTTKFSESGDDTSIISLEFVPKPNTTWNQTSRLKFTIRYDRAYDDFGRKTLVELQESILIDKEMSTLKLKKKALADLMFDIDTIERNVEEMKKHIVTTIN